MRQPLFMMILGLGLAMGSVLPPATAEQLDMDLLLPKDETAAPAEETSEAGTPETNTPAAATPPAAAETMPSPATMPETLPAPATSTSGDVLTMPAPPKTVSLTLPGRGMKKAEVEAKFGAPVEKVEAVGQPPISRWVYPEFTVYFESDIVLHAVLKEP